MSIRLPKNTGGYHWTEHAKFKMRFYGLSAQKVLGVIRNPKRKEEGIVKNTTAVMQPAKTKRPSEIWVMYQKRGAQNVERKAHNAKHKHGTKNVMRYGLCATSCKIISAWRYPGVSPKKNPIPEEILSEIEDIE